MNYYCVKGGRLSLVGWRFLEIKVSFASERFSVEVQFDTGQGFNSRESYFLLLRNGKTTKRICYFPFNTRKIRFVFNGALSEFEVLNYKLVWLTPMFARDRIRHRLSNFHPEYRYLSKKEIKKKLELEVSRSSRWIEAGLERYNQTFDHFDIETNYLDWLRLNRNYNEPILKTSDIGREVTIAVFILLSSSTAVDDIEYTLTSLSNQSIDLFNIYFVQANCNDQAERFIVEKRYKIIDISTDLGSLPDAQDIGWVGFFKAGDSFEKHCISSFLSSISKHPDSKIVYADEDFINESNERCNPSFKPGWNPDLLFSKNYMGRALLFRFDQLPRSSKLQRFYNADEVHLALLEQTQDAEAAQIIHIPHIVYHRRIKAEDNQATSIDVNKVNEHLFRYFKSRYVGIALEQNEETGLPRLVWPLPDTLPLVSLLIPTRDGIEILKPCVDAILSMTTYERLEVLILNNQSSCEQTLRYLEEVSNDERVRVLDWNFPFNYSAINNFGAEQAKGDIIGLVNNDIEPVNEEWLTEMVRQVCRDEIGCVGAKLYYPNDTIQHAGVVLGIGGVAGHSHRFLPRASSGYCDRLRVVQNYSAVTAACLLVRKSVYNSVGGLTEALAVAFNDVDFCLKVQALGLRNLWTPYAELYHHESISRGADNTSKKRKRALKEAQYMKDHWGALLECDPAYNPNLTLMHEDFSLR